MRTRRRQPLTDAQRELIDEAVAICGSQTALAEAMQTTQQTVSKLRNGEVWLSGEWAARIDRATGGRVAKEALRPDIFASEAA